MFSVRALWRFAKPLSATRRANVNVHDGDGPTPHVLSVRSLADSFAQSPSSRGPERLRQRQPAAGQLDTAASLRAEVLTCIRVRVLVTAA